LKLTKNIRNTAVRVLLNESEAIAKLSTLLNEDFENCVHHLLQSKGRLVITGVGKSAWIANKLVATLNSTGTPALFMHAADAIHGDLGMVQQDDTVLFISKSGNTAEIKVLIPLVKQLGVKVVALVSNRESFLAEHAHFVLNATINEEACPHNLTHHHEYYCPHGAGGCLGYLPFRSSWIYFLGFCTFPSRRVTWEVSFT